jgi:hypothetical protein
LGPKSLKKTYFFAQIATLMSFLADKTIGIAIEDINQTEEEILCATKVAGQTDAYLTTLSVSS